MTGEVRGVSGPIRHALVTVRQSFDSDYCSEGAQAVREHPDRFEFRRCLPFLFIYLGCIGLVWVGWSWTAVAVAFALYWIRMFGITAFYDRYFSHRTFRTSRSGQFAFAALGNTAVQRGALWWAAVHRHHHKDAETEHDVHSPGDDSRNNFLLAVVTLGEGWHNHHHRFMRAARQGFYCWEFDPTWYALKALSWTELIRDLNPMPERVYAEAEAQHLRPQAA